MNEGVKLLIERLKTCPEEFAKGGRWIKILAEYNEYIPDELKPLTDEVRKLLAEEFTQEVIKELLHADDDQLQLNLGSESLKQHLEQHRKWVQVQTTYGRLKYDAIEES